MPPGQADQLACWHTLLPWFRRALCSVRPPPPALPLQCLHSSFLALELLRLVCPKCHCLKGARWVIDHPGLDNWVLRHSQQCWGWLSCPALRCFADHKWVTAHVMDSSSSATSGPWYSFLFALRGEDSAVASPGAVSDASVLTTPLTSDLAVNACITGRLPSRPSVSGVPGL